MPPDESSIAVAIIDDSDVVRSLLEIFLNAAPNTHVVAVANSGEDGISAVLKQRPDVTIIDVHMPGIDGYTAATEILREWPDAKIIMNSADDNRIMKAQAQHSGVSAFAAKGMRPRDLHGLVLTVATAGQRPMEKLSEARARS